MPYAARGGVVSLLGPAECGKGGVIHLLRKGVPVYTVGKIVGHSSEKITERYSPSIPDDLEDAMSLLE
jgi:integrase